MTESGNAEPRRAYLGLGSNLGDKASNIATAIAELDAASGVDVIARSKNYRTAPWGKADQDWFVNACIAIETTLSPQALLDLCLDIERRMGRVRREKWGPRLIDIDVLVFENAEMATDALTLPHPFLLERAFVLKPLSDIAPDLMVGNTKIRDALAKIDSSDVHPLEP